MYDVKKIKTSAGVEPTVKKSTIKSTELIGKAFINTRDIVDIHISS
jgi:hypothetical protein